MVKVSQTVLANGLVLLIVGAAVPSGGGQESNQQDANAPMTVFVDDPEGDLAYGQAGGEGTFGEDEEAVDILRLEIGPEGENEIPVAVRLKQVPSNRNDQDGDITPHQIVIRFSGDGIYYVIRPNFGCGGFGLLELSGEDSSETRFLGCLKSEWNLDQAEVQINLPKYLLSSNTGAPLGPGAQLNDWWVETYIGRASPNTDPNDPSVVQDGGVRDRAPDMGGLDFALLERTRSSEAVPFVLSADNVLRATNGVDGAFRYGVNLTNPTSEQIDLQLSAANIWDNAQVLSKQSVAVPPGEKIGHEIFLKVEFGHEHGVTKWFTVRFTDEQSGEWSEIDLGLNWLQVPQPAGHHPVLYFHGVTQENTGKDPGDSAGLQDPYYLWMNTADEDPAGGVDDPPAPFNAGSGGVPFGTYNWHFRLDPKLSMGLNFTKGGAHMLSGEMQNLQLGSDVEITASLVVCAVRGTEEANPNGTRGATTNARFSCYKPRYDVASGSQFHPAIGGEQVSFEIVMPTANGAEWIPYNPDLQMTLQFVVQTRNATYALGAEGAPELVLDGMRLLLDIGEYTESSPLTGNEAAISGAGADEIQPLRETGDSEPTAKKSPGVTTPFIAVALLAIANAASRRHRH